MSVRSILSAGLLATAAMSPAAEQGESAAPPGKAVRGQASASTGQSLTLSDDSARLAGDWQIVAIDGRPLVPGSENHLAFGRTGYSGSAGCNSLQGYYLAHSGTFFSAPPIQTEMRCAGQMGAQEAKVGNILASAPSIVAGSDQISLVSRSGRIELVRVGEARWAPEALAWTDGNLQAELTSLDGAPLQQRSSEPTVYLRMSAGRFALDSGCGHLEGSWRTRNRTIHFSITREAQSARSCGVTFAGRWAGFKRLFGGLARLQVGASGELLLAGERAWSTGRVTGPSRRRGAR